MRTPLAHALSEVFASPRGLRVSRVDAPADRILRASFWRAEGAGGEAHGRSAPATVTSLAAWRVRAASRDVDIDG